MEMIHKIITFGGGDYASVVGLFATFAALYQAWRSRNAAEDAKNSLYYFDAIYQASITVAMLEDMATMQRSDPNWQVLADRYSEVKKHLIQIRKTRETKIAN